MWEIHLSSSSPIVPLADVFTCKYERKLNKCESGESCTRGSKTCSPGGIRRHKNSTGTLRSSGIGDRKQKEKVRGSLSGNERSGGSDEQQNHVRLHLQLPLTLAWGWISNSFRSRSRRVKHFEAAISSKKHPAKFTRRPRFCTALLFHSGVKF